MGALTLLLLSDLHVEFEPGEMRLMPRTDADVVVLAGDIHNGAKAIPWARRQYPDQEIVYVAGNHEYYGQVVPLARSRLRRTAANFDVRFLDQDAVAIKGVRFLGCPLWTDFDLFGEQRRESVMRLSQAFLNDFRQIWPGRARDPSPLNGDEPTLTPEEARRWHLKSRSWLERELAVPFGGPTVVVTHHAPHPRSLPQYWANDPASAAYASNLQDLFGRMSLWVHGHVHHSCDYALDGTRVVCNPRGYPIHTGADENPMFDPTLTVTV